jgi:hypothetical protein
MQILKIKKPTLLLRALGDAEQLDHVLDEVVHELPAHRAHLERAAGMNLFYTSGNDYL